MLSKNAHDTNYNTRKFPSMSDRDATIREILFAVYEALEEKGYKIESAELDRIPQTYITLDSDDDIKNIIPKYNPLIIPWTIIASFI